MEERKTKLKSGSHDPYTKKPVEQVNKKGFDFLMMYAGLKKMYWKVVAG